MGRARTLSSALALGTLALGACRSTPTDSARTPAPSVAQPAPSNAEPPSSAEPTAETAAPAPSAATPELPALAAEAELVPLPVPGYGDAVVSLPLGATTRRPIVVALHGNFDRPEWQCQVWREITRGFPFVLCPRGIPRRDVPKSMDRWEFASLAKTDQELDAAIAALEARFGSHVAPGSILFTGFSLGAILGVGILEKRPERHRLAVLIEGGYSGWSIGAARKFAEGGGARVLFACGQSACLVKTKEARRVLEQAGVEVRTVGGAKAGHTYDGPVAEAVAGEWEWLTAGDPRWGPGESASGNAAGGLR